ncbi:MAG: hypothetical protein ACKO38_21210 [Planctomycetota bacterium]
MRGEVVYLYAFDVANEIATREVRHILGQATTPFEPRAAHLLPRDVPLYRALTIEPSSNHTLAGQPLRVVIRVFEVGVVGFTMRAPFAVQSLAELGQLHQPKLDNGEPLDELARRLCAEVCSSLGKALVRSSPISQPEAYNVFCLAELDSEAPAWEWLETHREAAASLLAEQPSADLSPQQVEESLRIRRSFTGRDLVVIDWDASLVVDRDGYFDDVLYVLELANVQLEEYRVMDERLDRHVERAYRDLEQPMSVWGRGPTRMLDWLRRFRVDATKLSDEVTHITKFFGDWYLARVYLGAQERFHLTQWRQSIEHRVGQLDEVYKVIQSDVYERRMLWLEIAVVICFLVDLFGLFFWK